MSNRKFVVPRTTTWIGKPVIYVVAALAVTASTLAPVTARAQTASEVYKKMADVYTHALSFQGTIVRAEKGTMPNGKSVSQVVKINITFKFPNKYVVNTLKSMTVSGRTQVSNQIMVTDGKSLFIYSPERKLYQRGQIQNENMLYRFFALVDPVNGFLLLPETTVKGRAAFVLKPNPATKGTPEQQANAKKVKITVMVDKQNYQFLKMTISSPTGTLTQSVDEQMVNGSVSDSVFAWKPPAGYKEIKPTATGGSTLSGRAPQR